MAASQNCTQGLPPVGSNVAELTVAAVLLGAVFLVGLLCNLLTFVLTLGRVSKSRFHTLFIANLALADLLCGFVCPTQFLAHFVLADCAFRHAVRLAFEASQTLCVLSVVAISVDRSCVALWPVRYHRRNHRLAPWLILGALWLSGLLLHATVFALGGGGSAESAARTDGEHYTGAVPLAIATAEFLLPLAALLASNIIVNVRASQRRPLRRSLPASLSRSGGSDNAGDGAQSGASRRLSTPALSHDVSEPAAAVRARERRASSVAMAAQALREFRRRRLSALPGEQKLKEQEEFIRHVFHKRHNRTLKILVVLVLLFVVCRLPRVVFLVLTCAGALELSPARAYQVLFYLGQLLQLNASLDPVVYSFWGNRLYKRRVRALVLRLGKAVRNLVRGKPKPAWV